MTREEAIERLEYLKTVARSYEKEAYDMAIEALKAPTDTPTDLIGRDDAIEAMCGACLDDGSYCGGLCDLTDAINGLPSEQQVTGKLNNLDDSLLTADSEACKEQKSKLDLVSRADVIDAIRNRVEKSEVGESVDHDQVIADIELLPSAEPKTGECRTCKRSSDYLWSKGEDGTRCPIEEHYALPKDGYCHLYEQI